MSWRRKSSLDWLRALPGVSEDEALATRTSFGIGGPAEFFVESGRADAIERMIAGCAEREIPYRLLGAGTNLLIADAGVEASSSAWSTATTRSKAPAYARAPGSR